jgi:hypothetical protein
LDNGGLNCARKTRGVKVLNFHASRPLVESLRFMIKSEPGAYRDRY